MSEKASDADRVIRLIAALHRCEGFRSETVTVETRDARVAVDELLDLRAKVERLERWVDDLHAGMYINCVYCGHRYGPDDQVSVSMAEVLKEHVEQCPEHPMSKLKAEVKRLKAERDQWGPEWALDALQDARAEVERLKEALLKHGQHTETCDIVWEENRDSIPACTCGLSAALTEEGSHG
jgi:hypothetical protein